MIRQADEIIVERLRRLDELGLRRSLVTVSGRPGARCTIDGHEIVNFSSNDYLGLAGTAGIGNGLGVAAARLGRGAGASRLVGGNHETHEAVEREFADWMAKPRAVYLPSGYHANIAALTALCGPGDVIFSDELNHASVVDGCRLSGATVTLYGHCDAVSLKEKLSQARAPGLRVVVTESIFSVDGDEAPLEKIVALKRRHGFVLMVDEAHAVGCYGPEGRGICAEKGIERDVDVLVGTFGKAVGTTGAGIACGEAIAELVLSRGRSFMFTTATPPAVAVMVCAAIKRARKADGRRVRLAENTNLFRKACRLAGLKIPGGRAICPVVLGSERRALNAMNALWDLGFYVQALRPPTVPAGESRLRVSISAGHTKDDLEALVGALAGATDVEDEEQ